MPERSNKFTISCNSKIEGVNAGVEFSSRSLAFFLFLTPKAPATIQKIRMEKLKYEQDGRLARHILRPI